MTHINHIPDIENHKSSKGSKRGKRRELHKYIHENRGVHENNKNGNTQLSDSVDLTSVDEINHQYDEVKLSENERSSYNEEGRSYNEEDRSYNEDDSFCEEPRTPDKVQRQRLIDFTTTNQSSFDNDIQLAIQLSEREFMDRYHKDMERAKFLSKQKTSLGMSIARLKMWSQNDKGNDALETLINMVETALDDREISTTIPKDTLKNIDRILEDIDRSRIFRDLVIFYRSYVISKVI